jgi:hypothetical protein
MYGKLKSTKFIEMQYRDKSGVNNPQYIVIKSADTIAKLTKLVYVYNALDMSLVGIFSTVNAAKQMGIGKDTLSKYLSSGLPFKGKIYSRTQLH